MPRGPRSLIACRGTLVCQDRPGCVQCCNHVSAAAALDTRVQGTRTYTAASTMARGHVTCLGSDAQLVAPDVITCTPQLY